MEDLSSRHSAEKDDVFRVTARSAIADGIMFLSFIGGFIALVGGIMSKPTLWTISFVGAAGIVIGILLLTVFKFRKLVVEISADGIREYASKVSKGLIRWEEIESVAVYNTSLGTNDLSAVRMTDIKSIAGEHADNDVFLGIYLVDTEAYLKRLNVVQKGIVKLALKTGHAPINIPANVLEGKEDELAEICNRFVMKTHRERSTLDKAAFG
jgi:hypothetical protein